ncbi:VanZ family protein [Priestia aryabhattai]|uniref:VanZ family protein n=1 Tax=Priestia aryabhattai TaxID=412384 RepID=UPI002E1DBF87|nr:VanZ family protein [Priestia aryabhattai]
MLTEMFPFIYGSWVLGIVILILLFNRIVLKKKYKLEKVFMLLLSIFYLIGLLSVTLFPMPVDDNLIQYRISSGDNEVNNFIPLKSIIGAMDGNFIMSMIHQLGGNLILLFPLAIFIPILFPKLTKFKTIVLIGFLVSLLIESSQFTISSIIKFTYRSFDVDDLLLNTIGAGIGFLFYKYIYVKVLRDEIFGLK